MNNANAKSEFSVFLPVTLLAVALLTSLTWDLTQSVRQRMSGQRVADQQGLQIQQAAEMENKLRVVMEDLVILSKENAGALDIVTKFQIAFTPSAQQVAAQTPAQA
ncbi:MAG: hypothetical protein O3C57_03285, partial [Verrucomicrobia bacterium]|nr:hypothetical protein [Verrucomicrobiota bacterium]